MKQEIYDSMCRVLTDYETNDAGANDLYNQLVAIQNNWDELTSEEA